MKEKHISKKHMAISVAIVIVISIIIGISLVNCIYSEDYEYSIESFEIINADGSAAQVNLRVINKTDEKQMYYVRARAYKQTSDNLVGGGGRYIIAEANSNEVYSFIVDAATNYGYDLYDTYVKIETFTETNLLE